MIVIDASALIKLVLDEVHSTEAKHVVDKELSLGEAVVAPDVIFAEALNVIRTQANSNKALAGTKLEGVVYDLFEIFRRIRIISTLETGERALEVAIEHKVTTYDAVYIVASIIKGASLLTFDKTMALTGKKLGIAIAGPLGE